MKEMTSEEKGKKAEALFINYLDSRKIPYLRIDQEIKTKSAALKEQNIVRFDFLIQTRNDVYHIDVKYREKILIGEDKENRFRIGHDKIKLISNFADVFNKDLWLAFTDNLEKPEFYFSTISCINNYYNVLQEMYNKKYSNFSGTKYVYIPN